MNDPNTNLPGFPPLRTDDWGPTPEGYELRWAPETDDDWHTIEAWGVEPRPCRYTVGPNHATCKKPSVAMLRRRHKTIHNHFGTAWWHYCEDHLYGRCIVDGVIYHRVLRAVDQAPDFDESEAP